MLNNRRTVKNRKANRSAARRDKGLERLEPRQMMAAHIVGSSTVYQTIQAAVDAAMPGATINVDAGTYAEQVWIGKTLTIRGAEAGKDARSNLRAGQPESILSGLVLSDGTHTSSFYIAANDVTIDGFTVQGNTTVGDGGAGMVIAPNMSGTHVLNNIVQNNVSGLFLANSSATDPAIIQYNLFRNNNNPGSDGGRGIYTDGGMSGGNLTNVLIDSNAFISNYGSTGTTTLEAAIALESRTLNSQHYITITNNSFDSDGKGVLVYNADHIDIENNEATNCYDQWSGVIRSEGGTSYVTVTGNTIYQSTGPAVRIDEKGFAGPNFDWVVTNNNFWGNSTAYTNKQSVVLSALNQYDGTFIITNNYWGAASGPSGDETGTGDALVLSSNSAVYSPWATSMIGTGRMPYLGAPQSTGALIQFENFDEGGEGVAYHDNGAGNNGGAYRTGNTSVDLATTTDGGSGYMVTGVTAGEWLKYTINAAQAGTYTLGFRVASSATGGTFHVMIDGVNVTGTMAIPNTGSTGTWATITKTGIALTAGNHDVQVVFDTNNTSGTIGNFNWMQFTNTTAPAVPTAPDTVNASAAGFAAVSLTWQDNSSNETGFVIQRRALPYGTWTTVTTTAANVTSYVDTSVSASTMYSYRVIAINAAGQSSNSNESPVTTPPQQPITYVSDLPFATTPVNGWGPVEKDQSVGGSNAGDGQIITLNGVSYTKGLGTNAISDVTYSLGGAYGSFVSDIGIDDYEKYDGSVIFQVFADRVKVYDSGVMTPDSPTQTINLSMVGVQTLELHVDDAGDGPGFDQADWAGARLLLATPAQQPTVPATPGSLTATAMSQTQINLAWADVAGENGFQIQRSIDGVDFTQVGSVGPGVTSFSDTNLSAGTHYYYRVDATNSVGFSGYSNVADATTVAAPIPQPPVAPTNLTALASSQSQINLAWIDNSSDELNFVIERSLDGVTFTQIATPAANATSYSDSTGLAAGTMYYYRVYAVNAVGPSTDSNVATAMTVAAPKAPGAPSNLVASAISTSQINLSWIDNSSNETSFILERSTDGVHFTQIATPTANTTNYSDSSLAAGTMYYYRVSAANGVGASAVSNIASAATVAAPTAPAAPSNLVATAVSQAQINLTWADNSSNELNFVVERSTDNLTFTQIATPAANATSYSDSTGLSAGTMYYYRVRSVNAVGPSANSNIASASTPVAPTAPVAPSNLTATAISQTQINLTWADNSSNELNFILERSTDGLTFTQVALPAANATSYSDSTGLVAGMKFYYRVRATNAVGDSANSNIASATTVAAPTAPVAPSNLVASPVSTSQINLTWADNATNETGFIVERSTDNVTFAQIATPAANATSYSDATGLSAGTMYYYRVRATNAVGPSGNSNVASASTLIALPGAPSNLVAAALSTSQINLTWTDNASNELNFILERSTDNVTFTQIATPAANMTSYSDATGLSAGTMYYYRVRAGNSAGASANSNVASVSTLIAIPAAPSNLAASSISQTQVNLTWTDNAGNETGFVIERSTNNVTFIQIATPAANATSYIDSTGLSAGTMYYYRVRATNTAGASANSNVASATTAAAPTIPAAPSNLVATAISGSQINLAWADNSSNETGFIVERSLDGSTGWTQIAAPAANATSYSDATGLSATTAYYYRVRAINAVGASANTVVATATTLNPVPAAPSNLVAVAGNKLITLTWTDNSNNETNFVLERSSDGKTNWAQIATPGVNVTSTTDGSNLVAGSTYYYRLLAGNDFGGSAYSNIASATVPMTAVPAAPSNLVVTALSTSQISVTWKDNSTNESNFILERSTDGVNFTQIAAPAANATSYADGGLSAGTKYYYRIRASNAGGASSNSNMASATTIAAPVNMLPSGWTDSDLGSTGKAGSATYTGGVYTVSGAGAGIGSTSDALNFAGTTMNGNGTLTARVTSNTGVAGITLRDGTATNAKSISLVVNANGTVSFIRRTSVGGPVATTTTAAMTGAIYIRLQRVGTIFAAYTSTNGSKWTLVGATTASMSTNLNSGMVVTSKSTTTLATAKFDNVSVILG